MSTCRPALLPRPMSDQIAWVPHPGWGRRDTTYRERVWGWPCLPVVVVTEIQSNQGLSITNNAEAIFVATQLHWGPGAVVLEHYDHWSYVGGLGRDAQESFDRVELEDGRVRWTHVPPVQVVELITRSQYWSPT